MGNGMFIVIEGLAETGLNIQLNLLKERLKAIGYEVAVYEMPRLEQASGYFAKKYLQDGYGEKHEISPYTVALMHALDRYDASKDIQTDIDNGKIVLATGYVGASMAQQGSKFVDRVEQRGFFVWEDNLDFQLLKLPRPNINIVLRLSDESLRSVYKSKPMGQNEYAHLKKNISTFDLLSELFPKDYKAIEATHNGRLLSIPEVSNHIWNMVRPILPIKIPNPPRSAVVSLADKSNNHPYADKTKDELVVALKSASLMLRVYIEQALPGIAGDMEISWSDSDFTFYTPRELPKELVDAYKTSIRGVSETYKTIEQKLNKYFIDQNDDSYEQHSRELMQPLTPFAALSSFDIRLKKEHIRPLASRLLAADAAEMQWAAKQIYLAAKRLWPEDFRQPLETAEGPESINSILLKMGGEKLSLDSYSGDDVKLLEVYPRQEFDLLAESIYPYSSLSLREISEEVSDWPYQQKYESLKKIIAQQEILEKVRYKMDVISDHQTLAAMAKAARLKYIQVQPLTPRYGFDVPYVIEDARLDDLYNHVFDESLRLYSLLQSAGREDLAGYTTLLGHKTRWQLETTAANIKPALDNLKKLKITAQIHEKISETHPLLWEIMSGMVLKSAFAEKNTRNRVKPYHQRRPKRRKPKK